MRIVPLAEDQGRAPADGESVGDPDLHEGHDQLVHPQVASPPRQRPSGGTEEEARAVRVLESEFPSAQVAADPPDAWSALGVSLAELRRFEEATNVLETAVFHVPDSGVAWGRLGQACTETGRHREAMRAFERAIDLGFAPSGLWADMGRSAAELRDIRTLGRAYEKLRGDDPASAEVLRKRLVELQEESRGQARPGTGGGDPEMAHGPRLPGPSLTPPRPLDRPRGGIA